jgi:hypothetical protein
VFFYINEKLKISSIFDPVSLVLFCISFNKSK